MTPPSNSPAGTPSDDGASVGVSELTARRLVVALELLARSLQVGNHAAAGFANRDRTAEGRQHPAMTAMLAAVGAAAAVKGATGGRDAASAGASESRPVPVVIVGTKIPLAAGPAGGRAGATAIGGPRALPEKIDDAEVLRVVGKPKMLPAAARAMWDAPKPSRPDRPAERPSNPAPAPAGKDSGAGVAGALAAQFGRVIAPLLAFNTILGASNSGMSVFQKSVNVLATTLAPVLLPPLILLSAGLLTVSDVIWTKVRPQLAMWAELITTALVPAIEETVDNLAALADVIEWVVNNVPGLKKQPAATGGGGAGGAVAGGISSGISASWKSFIPGAGLLQGGPTALRLLQQPSSFASMLGAFGRQRQQQADESPGSPGSPPPAPQTAGDRLRSRISDSRAARASQPAGGSGSAFGDNLNAVITSMVKSLGPKAEYTTGAGADRARQLAAANGDPIDLKALLRAIESLNETQKGVRAGVERLNNPTAPQLPPSGATR